MSRLGYIFAWSVSAVAVVGLSLSVAHARTVHQTLVCKDTDNNYQPVFPCGLPENTRIPGKGSYDTGNAFGKVSYKNDAAGNRMQFRATGLERNTWYLVTLQDPTGGNQFSSNEAMCLFGIKSTNGLEFCDIALVKTNNDGSVQEIIPSDGGLEGKQTPVCESGNVPNLTPGPSLGEIGTSYTELTLVVKNVGVGDDGTTPSCSELLDPTAELFELDVLPDFTL